MNEVIFESKFLKHSIEFYLPQFINGDFNVLFSEQPYNFHLNFIKGKYSNIEKVNSF